MLSHGFGSAASRRSAIVGTAVKLNNAPHTVVGVLPASFDFWVGVRAGEPLRSVFHIPAESGEASLGDNTMAMIGRLKAGRLARGRRSRSERLRARLRRSIPIATASRAT